MNASTASTRPIRSWPKENLRYCLGTPEVYSSGTPFKIIKPAQRQLTGSPITYNRRRTHQAEKLLPRKR